METLISVGSWVRCFSKPHEEMNWYTALRPISDLWDQQLKEWPTDSESWWSMAGWLVSLCFQEPKNLCLTKHPDWLPCSKEKSGPRKVVWGHMVEAHGSWLLKSVACSTVPLAVRQCDFAAPTAGAASPYLACLAVLDVSEMVRELSHGECSRRSNSWIRFQKHSWHDQQPKG